MHTVAMAKFHNYSNGYKKQPQPIVYPKINQFDQINQSEANMETLNASDAKREFGEVLIKAQHRPIGINKNGEPVAVVISAAEYAQLEALKEKQLKQAILKGIDDLKSGKVKDGKNVIDKLRKKVSSGI